jgi:hypothetical protein
VIHGRFTPNGWKQYLATVGRELATIGARLLFVDGNHESFDVLDKSPRSGDGPVALSSRGAWPPRGARRYSSGPFLR